MRGDQVVIRFLRLERDDAFLVSLAFKATVESLGQRLPAREASAYRRASKCVNATGLTGLA